MDDTNQSILGLQFDQNSIVYLAQAGKWAKFLGIVGFIMSVLFILIGIFAGTIIGSSMSSLGGRMSALGGGAFMIIYILIALIYVLPCLYLYRFGSQVQAAIRSNELERMNTSLRNLKSFFKYIGILVIVMLCFYAIAAIGGVLFMGMMR